ncbi:MAG TPA: UPF0182 family protein, partial [Chloroflexia bacterium]|nr:UPF0182 family protein [Chloroflexia bacterium]
MSNRTRTASADRAPQPIRRRSSRIWWIVTAAIVLGFILVSSLAEMLTDWMWFGSQNLAEVYTTRLWLGLGVFIAATLLAGLFLYANWMVAWRIMRPGQHFPGQREPLSPRLVRWITAGAALLLGAFLGLVVAGEWPTILLYLNGVPFGQTDPLFNHDIGFYVFGLPFFRLLRGWAFLLVILTAIGALAIYLFHLFPSISSQIESAQLQRGNRANQFTFNLDKRVSTHLSVLGSLLLLLIAAGYWLDRFGLLFSSHTVADGASYTDVNAHLPALYIMMVVAVVMAVLLLVNVRVRTWKLLLAAVGVWLLALVLVGWLYPAVIQQFVVSPSEFQSEKPYIENNIAATRKAFGLDKFHERQVPAVSTVTQQQISDDRDTVENIRLWDYRPLLDTYSQLQEIRSYYSFGEVDIDRYTLGGKQRQVMLSARELNSGELNEQVRTWQNQHFVYTHGYGAVVSPVNEIEGEGLPKLLVKDIPPVTDVPELKITRPEVYYGEQADEYVFVNGTQQEFDYPLGDSNKQTTYAGKGGVEMSSFFTKLLFAVRFGDGNLMLTNYITPQTKVLFHRNIHDSVRLLAPFLMYDHDPYLVIADGKLYWVQDAYTYTDRYPYASEYNGTFNYIRNSVKVVIDAYDGTTTFYVADKTDPLVKAYRGIFPALFRDIEQMPASVRSHIRYPEDIMNIQARMYATFHMTDPFVFYQKEDVWNVPFGTQSENVEPLEAYYVNMQLPGETKDGFMLILPFTPAQKDNMIAWMAARSDGSDYGTVDVIRYPKQQQVFGPKQIEARIDQDPIISQQLTLWNQSGSKVRRGNLLTIPISDTVLYVEPLFLQAVSSRFPELKRVIVATGSSVGIGTDLQGALDVAFNIKPGTVEADGGQPAPTPGPGQTPQPRGTPSGSAADLTQSALQHYERAQAALKLNDWG